MNRLSAFLGLFAWKCANLAGVIPARRAASIDAA
jgi:ABC-type lipoprotein release transport system permease subunit